VYSKYAEIISLLLIIGYTYKKTRDRIVIWGLICTSFIICTALVFKILFPNMQFGSPTCEYLGFLSLIGIAFFVFISGTAIELDRRRKNEKEKVEMNMSWIFELSKDNIIFWTLMVLINLLAFILEHNK